MKNSYYKKIIKHCTIGYAYHKIIFDKQGKPCDLKFIEVNDDFKNLIGITEDDIVGRLASSIPLLNNKFINLLNLLTDIDDLKSTKEFEQYFEAVNQTYNVQAFSPKKNYLVTLISESSKIEKLIFDDDQKYKMIVNKMNDTIWMMDLNLKLTYLSPSIKRLLAYSNEELLKLNIYSILTPSSLRKVIKVYREELEIERSKKAQPHRIRVIEVEQVKKDGSKIIVEHVVQFIRDKNKRITGILGLGRDITEWVSAKESVQKSKEQLQLILNSTAEGIYGIDLNGNCTFCNASCLRLLGYNSEEELLGKNMHSLLHHQSNNEDSSIILNNLISPQGKLFENEIFIRKDKTTFIGEYFSYPQYHEEEIIGAVITFFDLTSRVEVENELKESERSKSVLLANLPGMAYRCKFDHSWTMTFASNGCYQLTGYRPENLINNRDISFNDLIKPKYRDFLWNEWKRIIETKENFRQEYIIITASKEEKWVLEQGQVIYDEHGNVEALEGLIIDINEQKNKQKEIEYLSYYDPLTGLHNRSYFEKMKNKLDKEEYLPLSLIIGDINGLKLINDALGHHEGDKLIKESAQTIKSCCEDWYVLARTSGDEFSILLPNTDLEQAAMVANKIQSACEEYNVKKSEIHQLNLAFGYATKYTQDVDYLKIQKTAENFLYKRKLLERNSSHSAFISSIKRTMFERSFETEQHAERLASLSNILGKKLQLSQAELDELSLLATLHDIGKVGIDNNILNKPGKLNDLEWVEMKKHPEIGYRIAMASPELSSIANYILCHHEKWDGSGYPQGLKGEEIPILSRIISVVDAYDAMTEDRPYRKALSRKTAIKEILDNKGTQFDPNIVEIFIELIKENGHLNK